MDHVSSIFPILDGAKIYSNIYSKFINKTMGTSLFLVIVENKSFRFFNLYFSLGQDSPFGLTRTFIFVLFLLVVCTHSCCGMVTMVTAEHVRRNFTPKMHITGFVFAGSELSCSLNNRNK